MSFRSPVFHTDNGLDGNGVVRPAYPSEGVTFGFVRGSRFSLGPPLPFRSSKNGRGGVILGRAIC